MTHIDLEHKRPVFVFFGAKPSFILMEDDKLLQYWNVIIGILMMYLAVWVPYYICMLPISEDLAAYKIVDKIIDVCLLIDMLV